jgi:hypothetical protein
MYAHILEWIEREAKPMRKFPAKNAGSSGFAFVPRGSSFGLQGGDISDLTCCRSYA